MESRNSTDKNLHFGDIHELARRVNEAPTPSWQKSTEMSKPKKVSNRKRMSQDSKPVPEFHSSTEDKADAEVPKLVTGGTKEDNGKRTQDSTKKAFSKAKTVPKENGSKASSKPKGAVKTPEPSNVPIPSEGLSALWHLALASKAGKFAESQVWIDKGLYHQIEAFNLKCGKPVPTKHVINAILRMFMDEHKTEIQKAEKRT